MGGQDAVNRKIIPSNTGGPQNGVPVIKDSDRALAQKLQGLLNGSDNSCKVIPAFTSEDLQRLENEGLVKKGDIGFLANNSPFNTMACFGNQEAQHNSDLNSQELHREENRLIEERKKKAPSNNPENSSNTNNVATSQVVEPETKKLNPSEKERRRRELIELYKFPKKITLKDAEARVKKEGEAQDESYRQALIKKYRLRPDATLKEAGEEMQRRNLIEEYHLPPDTTLPKAIAAEAASLANLFLK